MSAEHKLKFCAYCRRHKKDDGLFKAILHAASNTLREQCGACQATRRKPRTELNQLAKREAEERKARASEEIRAALDRKRKSEDPHHQ